MRISKCQAKDLAKKFKINLEIIPFKSWLYGLNVELEHGSKFGDITNITNDNPEMTARIVMAHLIEFPDYYKRLKKLESKADEYWEFKEKPNIFL